MGGPRAPRAVAQRVDLVVVQVHLVAVDLLVDVAGAPPGGAPARHHVGVRAEPHVDLRRAVQQHEDHDDGDEPAEEQHSPAIAVRLTPSVRVNLGAGASSDMGRSNTTDRSHPKGSGNNPGPRGVVLGMATTVPSLTLNNGTTIPQLGFGNFQVPPEQTADTVTKAFEAGYRHIDTAQMYGNEQETGVAIAASGIPRDELFITSKLNNGFHRPDDAKRAFGETLDKLGLDHIDLFLIHWPLPTLYDGDYVSTWRTLTEFVAEGRARAVGVSNFQPAHLDRIVAETGVMPAVNQIEAHPFFRNEEARAATHRHGALVEAWSPIAQGAVLDDETIGEVAAAHDKTPSQVTLRWHVQRGDIVFPKTTSPERMAENFAIFDFELSDDEVAAINGLDKGEDGRTGPNPDTFDYVPD